MSLRTEAYYRSVAADALALLNIAEPPVPVDVLVAALGIPLRAVNLPAFFTGALVYEDGLPVMIINWARPELERRRAMAHLLGHVLLVLGGQETAYPRDRGTHASADLVAREIILPSALVIEQARLWFNDHRYLSRLFGVTEVEMVERMRELGLMRGPSGINWDY